jgi:hypothetical protein
VPGGGEPTLEQVQLEVGAARAAQTAADRPARPPGRPAPAVEKLTELGVARIGGLVTDLYVADRQGDSGWAAGRAARDCLPRALGGR